jgi:glycerophosphoryl diester phosphodiesterase
LKLCNYDGCPTHISINTLDEVLEHLKGRVYINVDKFGANPAEIIEVIRRHGMKDQIVLKCGPQKNRLEIVETYAPDIPFLVVISEDNGCHEMLKNMDINYIGAELLFKTEDDEIATEKYRQTLRNDDKLLWVNTIVYDSNVVLAAGHSDDAAVSGDPEFGWGWCADRFDILQTDWVGQCARYLNETGRRYNK